MNTRMKDIHGFSLTELVVALAVMSIGLGGALTMITYGMSKLIAVDEYAIAHTAVQNEIETLRAGPFDDLIIGEHITFRSTTAQLERLPDAQPRVVVRDTDTAGLKEITVSVAWRGDNGRRIERSVTTLLADRRP
jgi:prepilin-type N-terminal cleavage/methylation domain-containing protein